MRLNKIIWIGMILAAAALTALAFLPGKPDMDGTGLAERLTDREFWDLSTGFSEPGGSFHSDNFVSNEGAFQLVIPDLIRRARQDGLYIGVGPEQNFTYIAALHPRMAFIVDIRRGNLQEHLLYKALFELSSDRAEFLSRLFSRARPGGLDRTSSVDTLFAAYEKVPPTEALYRENLQAVIDRLTKTHDFPLSAQDLEGIDYIYKTAFFNDGPGLNYRLNYSSRRTGRLMLPTYAELMTLDDGNGVQRSFLAMDENFGFIKDLESRNMIVPVVGDFSGAKALRAVGKYARDHNMIVSAFYLSNVEQYLQPYSEWDAFCANVASMPLDETSTFIRSIRGGSRSRTAGGFSPRFTSSLGQIIEETQACAATR